MTVRVKPSTVDSDDIAHQVLVKLGLVNPFAKVDAQHDASNPDERSQTALDPKNKLQDLAEPDGDEKDGKEANLPDTWSRGVARGELYHSYDRTTGYTTAGALSKEINENEDHDPECTCDDCEKRMAEFDPHIMMYESAAPGTEDWVKANKARFKQEYGEKKGLNILYATSWKMHKKKLKESLSIAMRVHDEILSEGGVSKKKRPVVSEADKERLRLARETLNAPDGQEFKVAGMSKQQARALIIKLTGRDTRK